MEMLTPEKRNDPFDPICEVGGTRSIVADDFTDAEIRFFNEIVETTDRPLLKGRLADLVWVRNKSFGVKNALDAIDSYRQLPLDADTWFIDGERCWQRAIDISRMIGATTGERLDEIEASIIKALKEGRRRISSSVIGSPILLCLMDLVRVKRLQWPKNWNLWPANLTPLVTSTQVGDSIMLQPGGSAVPRMRTRRLT